MNAPILSIRNCGFENLKTGTTASDVVMFIYGPRASVSSGEMEDLGYRVAEMLKQIDAFSYAMAMHHVSLVQLQKACQPHEQERHVKGPEVDWY